MIKRNEDDISSVALIIKPQVDNCLTIVDESSGIAVSEFKNDIYIAYNGADEFPVSSLTLYREIKGCVSKCPCDKIKIKNLSTMAIKLIDVIGFEDHPDVILSGEQVVIKNETNNKCKPITVISVNRSSSSSTITFTYNGPTNIKQFTKITSPTMWLQAGTTVALPGIVENLRPLNTNMDITLTIMSSGGNINGKFTIPKLPNTIPAVYSMNNQPREFNNGTTVITGFVTAKFTFQLLGDFFICDSLVISF
ncbi:MAG: hypothetical protein Harvfovirus36_12 [Harvfovirus sp.]|uniref:Uncharacterized protein n=1 Tax=Harvfovirus sp. TaxID=2487768 RepID=A0A3G5A5H1_9VIRU|nr:MAG: hypothetical protein Harvfovirus36_12 [Harvfovirus sp.]